MKRNIIIASLMFMLTLFVASCVKEYEQPNDGTDVTWYVTGRDEDQNYDPIIIVQDDYLGFMDCSLGATSHIWEVSEDGTHMLSGTPKGSNLVVTDYIDETIDHTTSNESILVLFRTEGLHKVRLLNTFDDEVTYRYKTVQSQTFADEFTATKIGDEYVIDTTLMVEVYGKTLIPDAKVYSDAQLLNEVQTGVDYVDEDGKDVYYSHTLKYGEKLYFVDNSTYKPNVFTWKCTAAGIGVDEEVSGEMMPLQFNMLTSGTTKFNVIHTVERSADLVENSYITSASSMSITIPLNIYVEENAVKVVPTIELAPDPTDENTYVSAINVTLPNTSFLGSQFSTDLNDDGVTSNYSNLVGSISASGVSGSVTNSYQCTGITWNENTPNLIRIEFSKQFYTSDAITVTFAEDLTTDLSDNYEGNDYLVSAASYNVTTNVVENLLQEEVRDIDYLYKMLCEEAGITYSANPTDADLAAANNNLAFKKALRNVFLCDVDGDGNSTADVTIAKIDEVTSHSAATATSPNFDDDDVLCLKISVERTSAKLRLNSDYIFDLNPATYSFSMNMAVALNGNSGNAAPATGGIQAMICDPYPASYASAFFDGSTLEYYSIKSFDTYGTDGNGRWCYFYAEDPIATTISGYDKSLSLTLSYYEPGTEIYIRDLTVTTATYSK